MTTKFSAGAPKGTFDAVIGMSFSIKVDGGREIAAIKEVSGLKLEVDVIELKQQNAAGHYVNTKILGRPKSGTITLTRVMTEDDCFEKWMQDSYDQVPSRMVPRADAVITVYDVMMKPVKKFTVQDAQPSSLEITQMQAGGTAALEEKLTLHHVGIKVEKG
jgi:phage tail-like protein